MSSTIINPAIAGRTVKEEFRELWGYRELIWTMIERDLRVRYKGSVLGILWSMIVPLMQAFTYTVVMGKFLGSGPHNQSALILCALIPWTFFQTAILDGSQVILSQMALVKKVYFPREIPVIATAGANLIHLLTSLVVFVIYRWCVVPILFGNTGGLAPPWQLVFLPVVILTLFMLTLGVSFFVAATNVFFEDVKFIVQQSLQIGMFLSAVIYPVENIFYSHALPAGWRHTLYSVFLLNPIAWIVTGFKQMFFPPQPIMVPGVGRMMTAPFDWRYCLIALVLSMIVCYSGYRFFNASKWRFTERP